MVNYILAIIIIIIIIIDVIAVATITIKYVILAEIVVTMVDVIHAVILLCPFFVILSLFLSEKYELENPMTRRHSLAVITTLYTVFSEQLHAKGW